MLLTYNGIFCRKNNITEIYLLRPIGHVLLLRIKSSLQNSIGVYLPCFVFVFSGFPQQALIALVKGNEIQEGMERKKKKEKEKERKQSLTGPEM